ncbi:cation transporter [Edaphobacter modestus]|uniref:Cation efflux family protein n=1 Tax=Edaphobacter modestus TaxID=388466 RepID=A0A4V2G336_9BACT|nr:cation transporter [Edaphobacter modestus]RZU35486.1 cation efflux family protein [Edaphobacter modestus]
MGTAIFSGMDRAAIARRGRNLEYFTIAWAGLEAAIALVAAIRSNSLSLTGFGIDSLIEVVSGAALLWRMSHEMDHRRRHHAEHVSLRIAGVCLLALGAYVLIEATFNLWRHRTSETSWIGAGVTTAALIFMPLLSRAKRKVGLALNSTAMMTDAKQTDFCTYQAAIVLFGLLVHATFGIGWADSAAALLLVPLLLRAGTLSLRGRACCAHHSHVPN